MKSRLVLLAVASVTVLISATSSSYASATVPSSAPRVTLSIESRRSSVKNPVGLSPATVNGFYQLHPDGTGQVIAIIAAYHHPNALSDLNVFSKKYGLPQLPSCTSGTPLNAQACFMISDPQGVPSSNINWSLETALDVQWAHAEAPNASIVLVEARNDTENPPTSLMKAVDWANANGATEVSMSFGSPENLHPTASANWNHFNKPGVLYTASAGDLGTASNWPASSQNVIAVGGTTFNGCTATTCGSITEEAWSDSGGGISPTRKIPSYQANYKGQVYGASTIGTLTNNMRGVPDVTFFATGVSVYDSDPTPPDGTSGWESIYGTSIGAPAWAGILASGASTHSTALQGLSNMYAQASNPNLRDVVTGSNGSCGKLCTAGVGYDLVSGLGSPYNYP